jgi:hypothetical protein
VVETAAPHCRSKPVAIFLLSRSAAFGKTTIVKAILRILAAKNIDLLLWRADGRLMGPTVGPSGSNLTLGALV